MRVGQRDRVADSRRPCGLNRGDSSSRTPAWSVGTRRWFSPMPRLCPTYSSSSWCLLPDGRQGVLRQGRRTTVGAAARQRPLERDADRAQRRRRREATASCRRTRPASQGREAAVRPAEPARSWQHDHAAVLARARDGRPGRLQLRRRRPDRRPGRRRDVLRDRAEPERRSSCATKKAADGGIVVTLDRRRDRPLAQPRQAGRLPSGDAERVGRASIDDGTDTGFRGVAVTATNSDDIARSASAPASAATAAVDRRRHRSTSSP